MKSTTFALAAAAIPLALAVPFEKRAGAYEMDYVTDLRITTVTTQITVYYTGQPAAQTVYPTPAAPAPAVVTAAPSEAESYNYVAQVEQQAAEAPAAPSVDVASVQPESVAEQPAVVASSENTPAVAEQPAAQSVSSSSPGAGYGPGPYTVNTGSGTIEAYVGSLDAPASFDSNGALQAGFLNATNYWRSLYKAAPLSWDQGLADLAQQQADFCSLAHPDDRKINGKPYGQNTAQGAKSPQATVEMWCGENSVYPWSDPESEASQKSFPSWGHFSQSVWQSTTSIGCAVQENCQGEFGRTIVCNYFPAGNGNPDTYPSNVLR